MPISEYFRAVKQFLVMDSSVESIRIIRERTTANDGHLRAKLSLVDGYTMEFSEYAQLFPINDIKIVTEDQIIITTGGGDVYFAKDQAIQNINRVISQAPGIPENIETKLKELTAAVDKMISDMPDDKSAKAAKNLKNFTEEAVSKEPDQDYLAISKKGLIEAAQTVGAIGKPVIDITLSILKMLVP